MGVAQRPGQFRPTGVRFQTFVGPVNQDGANSLISGVTRGLTEANAQIDEIVKEERRAKIAEIQAERDKTATILTNISLAFETSQAFGSFVA